MSSQPHTIQAIVNAVDFPNLNLVRGAGVEVLQFASPELADAQSICFVYQNKLMPQIKASACAALVISPVLWAEHEAEISCAAVVVSDSPYAFFALAAQWLESQTKTGKEYTIHPTAIVAPDVLLGQHVNIGAYAVIDAGSQIGDFTDIGAHCSVGANSTIGKHCLLHAYARLYHGVHLGERVIVHSNAVIGADGFGFAPYQKRWLKIPQTGGVRIGDDVEIGAGTMIDRGALGDTVIGRGTKFDNLIQVAHNVHIGEDCAFAACVAIAGSAVIGSRVQAGGGAGILGHLSVCDDVVISTFTLITKTIHKPGFYTGVYPFEENADWEKNAVSLRRLSKMREQVRSLEKNLAQSLATQHSKNHSENE